MAGLAAAFGSGAMTNTIADIEEADVILITGSNTTENHPVLSSVVKRAVTAKGTKLIVVDPRRIKITRYANMWLRQNLGTDVAWINGLMHVIIKENLHNQEFIDSRTEGFEELKQTVEKFPPDYVEHITGIPAQEIIDAAKREDKPGAEHFAPQHYRLGGWQEKREAVDAPLSANALSKLNGKADAPKDFDWLEKNIPCQKACPSTPVPGRA